MKEASGNDLIDFYATSDNILRLSLLTHVHRASPRAAFTPTRFSPECLRVARLTLQRHHDYIDHKQDRRQILPNIHSLVRFREEHRITRLQKNSNEADTSRTLLFAPFIPFIVLFCNVMKTRDKEDLARLEAFVESIQPASTLSEPAARMHQLFQVLHNIAQRYIELGDSAPRQGGQYSSADQMDADLAALGVPRFGAYQASGPGQGQQTGQLGDFDMSCLQQSPGVGLGDEGGDMAQHLVNPVLWMGNGPQLEDWFYSNEASMKSLQDMDAS